MQSHKGRFRTDFHLKNTFKIEKFQGACGYNIAIMI